MSKIAFNFVPNLTFSISKISALIPHLVKYAKELKKAIAEIIQDPKNPMNKYFDIMKKYENLGRFLSNNDGEFIDLKFTDIEKILGFNISIFTKFL